MGQDHGDLIICRDVSRPKRPFLGAIDVLEEAIQEDTGSNNAIDVTVCRAPLLIVRHQLTVLADTADQCPAANGRAGVDRGDGSRGRARQRRHDRRCPLFA